MKIAKLFENGRSQAVRLPKAFRMPGSEVRIRRDSNRIILEPLEAWMLDTNLKEFERVEGLVLENWVDG